MASPDKKNGSALFVKGATRAPALLEDVMRLYPNLQFSPPQPNIYFAEFDHGPMRFYFLRNPKPEPEDARVLFPVTRTPEIWNAWTGEITSAPHFDRSVGGTTMDIHLNSYDSVLVGFGEALEPLHVLTSTWSEVREVNGRLTGIARQPGVYYASLSDGRERQTEVAANEIPSTLTLGPNWFLRAVGKDKNGREYTREVHLTDLKDWTLVANLHTFSGKGYYSLDFALDERYLKPGLMLNLDLGEVHDVAEVWINGRKGATLLLRPYRMDATPYFQAGNNHLEIIVTNTLRNRLVGDGSAGDPNFIVFRNRLFYLPSGMVGPVRLVPNRTVDLQ